MSLTQGVLLLKLITMNEPWGIVGIDPLINVMHPVS